MSEKKTKTISPTGGKQKTFYGQFTISVTPIERMFLGYYAQRYNKDRGEILRGMLHKYVQIDKNFDTQDFLKWAEKTFLPAEEDKDLRKMCKEKLANYRATLPATEKG